MTNQLDRRLRKLEASAKPIEFGAFRLVLVPAGSLIEHEVAKLADRQTSDELCVVRFIRPSDVPRAGEAIQ